MYLFFCRSTTAEGHSTVDSDLQWEQGGGVDLHDQHRAYYLVGWPCKKWWCYLFWFFVQSSLISAFIIFEKSNQPAPRSKKMQDPPHFHLAVFDGLVKGNIVMKRQTQMQESLTGRAISDPTEHPIVRMLGRNKNCMQCQSSGRRTPKGRGIESVYGCTTCKVHLCKGRSFAHFHLELLQWSPVHWAVICSLCMCDRLHKVPLWSTTVCYLALKGGHWKSKTTHGYSRQMYLNTGKNKQYVETFVCYLLLIFKVVYLDHLT